MVKSQLNPDAALKSTFFFFSAAVFIIGVIPLSELGPCTKVVYLFLTVNEINFDSSLVSNFEIFLVFFINLASREIRYHNELACIRDKDVCFRVSSL